MEDISDVDFTVCRSNISSAYVYSRRLEEKLGQIATMSLMYSMNNIGPRIDP